MARGVRAAAPAPGGPGKAPAGGSAGLNVGTAATATFSEPMRASTVGASSFTLTDGNGASVPANVSFDAATNTATLTPQSALQYGVTYRATVVGGSGGATDLAGNP